MPQEASDAIVPIDQLNALKLKLEKEIEELKEQNEKTKDEARLKNHELFKKKWNIE